MADMQTTQVASTVNRRDIVLALGFALIIANVALSKSWQPVWQSIVGSNPANSNEISKAGTPWQAWLPAGTMGGYAVPQ